MGAIKTASKKSIQKTAETTSHLIGNKIADKIIRVSKKSGANSEIEVGRASSKDVDSASVKDLPKKDTYLQMKDNKLLMS